MHLTGSTGAGAPKQRHGARCGSAAPAGSGAQRNPRPARQAAAGCRQRYYTPQEVWHAQQAASSRARRYPACERVCTCAERRGAARRALAPQQGECAAPLPRARAQGFHAQHAQRLLGVLPGGSLRPFRRAQGARRGGACLLPRLGAGARLWLLGSSTGGGTAAALQPPPCPEQTTKRRKTPGEGRSP